MLNTFSINFKKHFKIYLKGALGVAISGGVDSVVLAFMLKQIGIKITLLHCNFQLRGNASNGDQAFVKRLAERWEIPFITTEFNTSAYAEINKQSTQIAARELRYRWFSKMAKLHNLQAVATAHHLDDNLETFLINLSRGTGLQGLTGIPSHNGLFIRPLLLFSKNQIVDFANKENLFWREDASNSDTKYLRNKLRHKVIPNYKETNEQLLSNVSKTIQHLQKSQSFINTYISQLKKKLFIENPNSKRIEIEIELLLNEPELELVLFELFKDYNFRAWNDIKDLLVSQTGTKIHSQTHTLLKDRNNLLLYSNTNETSSLNKAYTINKDQNFIVTNNGNFVIKEGTLKVESKHQILIDKDQLKFPLIVRKWKDGDYFYPIGMQGKKKISNYFKDEKLSLPEKEEIWLLCSGKDIAWVVGKRADKRFQTTPKTKNAIHIQFFE